MEQFLRQLQTIPEAAELIRHGARGGIRTGLRFLMAERGVQHPPMVENTRNVGDFRRVFGQSKRQIMVLRAIEAGAKSADRVHQCP